MHTQTDPLTEAFFAPPQSTRPWTYWHWVSGHISREGITRDLELMAELGLGHACIGNVDINPERPGPIKVLSDEWWELCAFAVSEGKRLGIQVSSFNAPGWSQSGGPWIEPKNAMKFMHVYESEVSGGQIEETLPSIDGYFEPVALLAVPKQSEQTASFHSVRCTPEHSDCGALISEGNAQDVILQAAELGGSIDLDFVADPKQLVRNLHIVPGHQIFLAKGELWAGDDFDTLRKVHEFTLDRSFDFVSVGPIPWAPFSFAVPETRAKCFRIRLSPEAHNHHPEKPGQVCLRQIKLNGQTQLDHYMEKQLAKLQQTPVVSWDSYMWPEQEEYSDSIPTCEVQDLTEGLSAEGVLKAELPEGQWTLLRVVAMPTETKNSPASPEATGLEVDKMNRKALAVHIDGYIDELIRRVPSSQHSVMTHIIADSFETGAQNWTEGMREIFRERYGYDMRRWLPVLTGRIIDSAKASDAFLWDIRRLIADRIASEYVGGLHDMAEERGMKLWIENYGHWGYPAEFLQYGGAAHEAAGEFWTYNKLVGEYWSTETLGEDEVLAAACASHIYGKPVVSAEAFTAAGSIFIRDPWALKTRGDWAQTLGINHFLLHVWVHQPDPNRIPGVSTWYGTEFNANTAWMPYARCWIDYFRRCHALLQSGRPAADLLYFIGEDAPKMAGIRDPELPEGYDFDYINGEMLHRLTVSNDGYLCLDSGVRYRLLVLPPQKSMRPEILEKIAALVAAGAVIVGPQPTHSPSLEKQPAADRKVKELATQLWDNENQSSPTDRGKVHPPTPLQTILDNLDLPPALEGAGSLLWIQRVLDNGDVIFFISNPDDDYVTKTLRFRPQMASVELWHPEDERRVAIESKTSGKQTEVDLKFAPREAYFIIFRSQPSEGLEESPAFPDYTEVKNLAGNWQLHFDPQLGGPEQPIETAELADWRDHDDPAIRHYAGPCLYELHFTLTDSECAAAEAIELTDYANIAQVSINGEVLGSVWTRPGRLPVKNLRAGKNTIQIKILTSWNNRVVADEALPESERVLQVDGGISSGGTVREKGVTHPAGLWGKVRLVKSQGRVTV